MNDSPHCQPSRDHAPEDGLPNPFTDSHLEEGPRVLSDGPPGPSLEEGPRIPSDSPPGPSTDQLEDDPLTSFLLSDDPNDSLVTTQPLSPAITISSERDIDMAAEESGSVATTSARKTKRTLDSDEQLSKRQKRDDVWAPRCIVIGVEATFDGVAQPTSNTMHLPKFLLATLAVPAVNAWHIEMIAQNYDARGAFFDNSGSSYIDRDFNDGCYDRRIPSIVEFCVDWARRRGHLVQDIGNQSVKYCFHTVRDSWLRGNGPEQSQGAMYYYRWEPTECTWPTARDASVVEGDLSTPLVLPSSPGPEFEPFIVNSAVQ
ncbi:uncharacterized protein DNG_09623 [Cephalotrichum gorgonifer]|uniref:Uncharacterized protein n=1 Tax=Cephalotrichum gorgonifer TaxID=2041049 RepID=A0AAE8SZH8_9PEZI|nr:uncharacterized protein DNG_09623 [Cephalotrichum gorgonifer]